MAAYPPVYPASYQSQANQRGYPPKAQANASWVQPPYPGAPPIPAGVTVNPQQWQSGQWKFNPAYNQNSNPHQQHVPWIPSHHWMPQYGQQQQSQAQQQPQSSSASQQQGSQAASFNPYKRIPRAPSAAYLATKLVENPLGLFGMEEQNKHYDAVQTPWVWQPLALEDDEEEDGTSNSQPPSRSNTDPTQEGNSPAGSRKNSDNQPAAGDRPESFTSKRELQPTFSINIVRTPDHYRRNSITDTQSPSRTPSRESRSSADSVLSARMASLGSSSASSSISSSSSPTPLSRRSSMPMSVSSASPTKPEFPTSSAPMLGDQFSDEPASMLSPLIIASTPKPGPSPLRGVRNHATYPIISPPLSTIPESSNDNSRSAGQGKSRDPNRPNFAVHSSSMPLIPISNHGQARQEQPPQVPIPMGPTQPLPRRESYELQQQRQWESAREREKDRERSRAGRVIRGSSFSDPSGPTTPSSSRSPDRGSVREQDIEAEHERERQRDRQYRGDYRYDNASAPAPAHLGSRHTMFVDPYMTSNAHLAAKASNTSAQRVPSPPTTPSPRSRQQTSSRSSSRQSSRSSSAQGSPTYPPNHVTPPSNYPISPRPSPPTYPTHAPSKHSPPEGQHHKSTSSVRTITPGTYGTGISSASASASAHTNGPGSKFTNPLPPPPHLTHGHRAPFVPAQRTPPSSYHERVRRGFWNQRGDHLTMEGFLVYALPDQAFPDELRNYPTVDEGYQDHDGVFAKWTQRPELPESLPRMGKPPELPYEKFLVYEYR